MQKLKSIFSTKGKVSWPLIALFLFINLIAARNAVVHNPVVGYDSAEHIEYIDIIAEGRLPTLAENYEYFSPPLPYLLPALAHASGAYSIEAAAVLFKVLNVLYSVAACLLLISICTMFKPDRTALRLNALLLLALLPVYYKSFAMVRSDPLFMMLCLAVTWSALKLTQQLVSSDKKQLLIWTAVTGTLTGCAMLTRQWAIFLILALCLFWGISILKKTIPFKRSALFLSITMFIAFAISSWFFFHLKINYGAFGAFNRKPAKSFSLSNQDGYFYFGTGSGKLFKEPIRPNFRNQLIPILYSETWGDYWCYFLVSGVNTLKDQQVCGSDLIPPYHPAVMTNRERVSSTLARSNLLGVFPSIIILLGLFAGLFASIDYIRQKQTGPCSPDALKLISLIFSAIGFLGFMWFLIMYPHPAEGDTIKATYILQLFPFLCILGGSFLAYLQERQRFVYYGVALILITILLINLPVYLSRY